MAKFYGVIGYAITKESRKQPGVWEEEIVEKKYYGDIIRNVGHFQSSDKVNGDIDISNEISIVSDPFANENFHSIRYVKFMGTRWKVNSVSVEYPRLTLTIGGEYNG